MTWPTLLTSDVTRLLANSDGLDDSVEYIEFLTQIVFEIRPKPEFALNLNAPAFVHRTGQVWNSPFGNVRIILVVLTGKSKRQ